MIPYIIIFLFVFVAYWYHDSNSTKHYYFLMIASIIMIGSRDMIGGYDVYIYGEFFETTSDAYILGFKGFEYGYNIFNFLLRKISSNRYFFFACCAVLTIPIHFGVIKKLSPLLLFSIFIYFSKFFLMSFVYVRQFLAMAFIWMAIYYFINHKWKWTILFTIIGVYFHKSALIILPFFLIGKKRLNPQHIIIGISFFLILIIGLGEKLASLIIEASGEGRLIVYGEKSGEVNIFYFIEALILTLFAVRFRKSFYENEDTTYIFNGFLIAVFMTFISLTNATYIRFTWYYYLFIILALPQIYLYTRDIKVKEMLKIGVFVYFAALLIRMLLIWDGGDFIPYKAFYLDTERKGRFEYMEYRK